MSRFKTRQMYPRGFSFRQYFKHQFWNSFHVLILAGIFAIFCFGLFDRSAQAHLPEVDPRNPDQVEDPRILVIHHTEISASEHPVQFEMANASHQRRWDFKSPVTGYYLCYHYFIGTDGTVIQARGEDERPGCTRNNGVNDRAIQIVLAGNFEVEKPTEPQLKALRRLTAKLDAKYHFDRIIPHKDASPSSCPGKNLLEAIQDLLREPKIPGMEFQVSRYYTPVQGQKRYYRTVTDQQFIHVALAAGLVDELPGYDGTEFWYSFSSHPVPIGHNLEEADDWFKDRPEHREAIRKELEYMADFKINCSGDCFITADGTNLRDKAPMTVAACPPSYKFGQKIELDGIGVVTCHDRGGAIKGNRIDVWAGYGDAALDLLPITQAGKMTGRLL